jgi:hypothetical protein
VSNKLLRSTNTLTRSFSVIPLSTMNLTVFTVDVTIAANSSLQLFILPMSIDSLGLLLPSRRHILLQSAMRAELCNERLGIPWVLMIDLLIVHGIQTCEHRH